MRAVRATQRGVDSGSGPLLLEVSGSDLDLVKNALNEVVNGLPSEDDRPQIVADWAVARVLLAEVQSIRGESVPKELGRAGEGTLLLASSATELSLIRSALIRVVEEIDGPEFQTRLGVEPAVANGLAAAIEAMVQPAIVNGHASLSPAAGSRD